MCHIAIYYRIYWKVHQPIISASEEPSAVSPAQVPGPEVFGRARAQGIQRRLDALRQCHQQADFSVAGKCGGHHGVVLPPKSFASDGSYPLKLSCLSIFAIVSRKLHSFPGDIS